MCLRSRSVSWDEWIRTVEVEPALHAADGARIADQVEILLRAGARVFHFDLGEGEFGAAVSGGASVLQAIAPAIHRAGGSIDCHVTLDEPERELDAIRAAGGDSLTIQFELCTDYGRLAERARAAGFEGVGLALAPETPSEVAASVADAFDVVSVATVDPNVSSQDFLAGSLERLQTLRNLLPARIHLQADGGIDYDSVRPAYDAGADLLVADASIFGREDLPRSYRRLVQLLA
jgi:ribulose-phosphate 3-epimerase